MRAELIDFQALRPRIWMSVCARMEAVKEAPPHQTIKRRSDEPKLQIGDKVLVKDGVIGVVLARYRPSGGQNEVCYVVEVLSDEGEKPRPRKP
jgi:hypothetical protein